jgi:hypothetical protein
MANASVRPWYPRVESLILTVFLSAEPKPLQREVATSARRLDTGPMSFHYPGKKHLDTTSVLVNYISATKTIIPIGECSEIRPTGKVVAS